MGDVNLNTKVGFLSVYGQVVFGTNSTGHPTIKVELGNGYHVDLLARLIEAKSNWGSKCSVRLWQGSTDFTRVDAINSIASAFEGNIVVDFETTPIQYSEYTSDLEHSSDFNVGGHDLMQIIRHGMFLLIDINFSGAGWDIVDDAVCYWRDGLPDIGRNYPSRHNPVRVGTSAYTLINNLNADADDAKNFVEIECDDPRFWQNKKPKVASITSTPTLTVDGDQKPDADLLEEFF